MQSTSIFIADDHPAIRRGVRSLFAGERDLDVVGEAGDGLETVRLVGQLKPDIVVLDLMMPGLSGLDAMPMIRQRSPATRVIVYSMHGEIGYVAAALRNGALGYVLKGCEVSDLILAVRQVTAGKRYLCPSVSESAIDAYIEQVAAARDDPHAALTDREREVLQMSAEGKSSPEIAARLHISHRTVENHRAHVFRKLGLKNQSELVVYAIRHGLIPLDMPRS